MEKYVLPLFALVLIVSVIWYAAANTYTGRKSDNTAVSEEKKTYIEDLVQAVEENSEDTSRWRKYTHAQLGFSFAYPEGWEYEEMMTADSAVPTFVVQPVGKRYFREPHRLYPLVVEIIQDGEQAIMTRYPTEDLLIEDTANLKADTVRVYALADNAVAYVFKNPYQENVFVVLRDSVDTITGIAEAEKQELRTITDAIIAHVDFFQQ